LRGRNADWGERAVREAVSLSATDALEMKVIDMIAEDVPALLKALDGRVVDAGGTKHTLKTANAVATEIEIDWRTRVLAVITNPSLAYLLVLVGMYALIFEFANPGLILPGVAGAICVVLALYAFHLLRSTTPGSVDRARHRVHDRRGVRARFRFAWNRRHHCVRARVGHADRQ